MRIPILLSLYFRPLSASIHYFMTTNSAQNADVSTVHCYFEYYYIRAVVTSVKKPLVDHKYVDIISFPLGCGELMGIASLTFFKFTVVYFWIFLIIN